MTNSTFIFFPILAVILLTINIVLSPWHTYQDANSAMECGLHSSLGKNRLKFTPSFFMLVLLFLHEALYIIIAYTNGYILDGVTLILILSFIVTFSFSFRLAKQMNRAYENSKLEFFYVLKLINLYFVIYPFIFFLGSTFLIPCVFLDKVAVFFTLLALVYPILKIQFMLAIIFLALHKITSYTYAELKAKLKRVLIAILIWAISVLFFKQIIMFYFNLDPETWHYWLIGALSALLKEFFFMDTMGIKEYSAINSTNKIVPYNAINSNTTVFMVGNTTNGSTSTNNASVSNASAASTTAGPSAAYTNEASTSNNSDSYSNSHTPSINEGNVGLRESVRNIFTSIRNNAFATPNTFEAERPLTPDSLDSADWANPVNQPPSAEVIAQRVESTINEMGSYLPEHTIGGHNEVTSEGYNGGSFFDMVDEREGMDREQHGYPNFKPFTDNLADYLELYNERENARVNAHDFPPMDPTSIRWFVQWLNRCSPDYLENPHASGPRSVRVIDALRGDNNAFDALRRNSNASTPSER